MNSSVSVSVQCCLLVTLERDWVAGGTVTRPLGLKICGETERCIVLSFTSVQNVGDSIHGSYRVPYYDSSYPSNFKFGKAVF